MKSQIKLLLLFTFILTPLSFASSSHSNDNSWLLLAIAIMLGLAAISSFIQKIGFPAVLGELSIGMLIAILGHYQVWHWHDVVNDRVIMWLAEFGCILLLYEIGLESKVKDLLNVGKYGLITAVMGVVLPFALGFGLCKIMFPNEPTNLALFIGATLAATSTGISVRVFKDMGILKNPACQIVLTASIIDDTLGLIILSIVSGIVVSGAIGVVDILYILFSVVFFFSLAFIVASRVTPLLVRFFMRLNSSDAMVMLILISFGLFWAWLATSVGLAAIIGSFVAGLILDEMFFAKYRQVKWHSGLGEYIAPEYTQTYQDLVAIKEAEEQSHYLISLIKPLNYFLVPLFFIYAGMQVNILEVANWNTLFFGGILSIVAIIGKVFCGVFLPKNINKWLVGFGMVPRGEIGLIFALAGRELGVFNQEIFAGILCMVVSTSIITPLALQKISKTIV
ncbi:MAG: cation:proton antiporter [Burkholderiales bacterium]|nr:cation:proton antiporter [Burkholderiales bacterium]